MSTAALLHLLTGQAYLWGVGGLSAILAYRLWRDHRRGAYVMVGLVWMALSCGPHHMHLGMHLTEHRATGLDLTTVAVALPFGAMWLWWQAGAVFSERSITLQRHGGGRPRERLRTIMGWLADHWPSWWHSDRTFTHDSIVPVVMAFSLVAYCTFILTVDQPDEWNRYVGVQVALVVLYLIISGLWWTGQLRRRQQDFEWSAKGVTLGMIWATCAMSHWSFAVAVGDGDYHADGHMLLIDGIGVPAATAFIALVWWLRGSTNGKKEVHA